MFADVRATIQSVLTATRNPIGWMALSRWIGSRSQLVRSTFGSGLGSDQAAEKRHYLSRNSALTSTIRIECANSDQPRGERSEQ